MDAYDAAIARRRLELYREYLTKGVHGGMAVVYLVEIAKFELLLKHIEKRSAPPSD